MKVAGFTFIKNAIKYDFPIVESIRSVLPLVDEMIVAVGASTDDTRSLIESIDGKIQIIDTVWNEKLLADGAVLADETNKAMRSISDDSDWCIYIQGDEVMHEKDRFNVKAAMKRYLKQPDVDGLLFDYIHFYGSYDYVGSSANWYRREIRILKNHRSIYSFKDAQGFRKRNDEKLRVKAIEASIYHYGWVKPPKVMFEKIKNDRVVRHGIHDSELPVVAESENEFDYSQIDQLKPFLFEHPAVMQDRIEKNNWAFDYDISQNRISIKELLKRWSERIFGYPIGEYRNYKLLK